MPASKAITFRGWLDRSGLTIASFAAGTGIDYNTVAKWSGDPTRLPRPALRLLVQQKYPDCPLAKG